MESILYNTFLKTLSNNQIMVQQKVKYTVMSSVRGAKQGGGLDGGLNTCQPPLILRKKILGGVGSNYIVYRLARALLENW